MQLKLRLPEAQGFADYSTGNSFDHLHALVAVIAGVPVPKFGFLNFPSKVKFDDWDKVYDVRVERDQPILAHINMIPEGDVLQPSNESVVLYEMIGELSQNYLECSYNEDDILQELINGTLNENIQFRIDHQVVMHFKEKMRELWREDGDYETMLFRAVIAAGGWGRGWSEEATPIDQVPGLSVALAKFMVKEMKALHKGLATGE